MAYKDAEKERTYQREYKQIRRADLAYRIRDKEYSDRYQEPLEVARRRRASARKNNNQRRLWQRALALDHYGAHCACCGESRDYFLAIDHIDGGGSQHKKTIGFRSLAGWLFENDWPKGFQVLCHNCNTAKYRFGKCPCQEVL